jgi:hypothetical protein
MPNKKKNGQEEFGPTHIQVRSYLHEKNRERGQIGRYSSKFTEFSLHRDLTDDMLDFSGTGAFLKSTNLEKGEKGKSKSVYKGVTQNDEGQFTYDVSREGGIFGSSARSRVISEKAAARKMRRFEKKDNRNVKRQERKSKRFGL